MLPTWLFLCCLFDTCCTILAMKISEPSCMHLFTALSWPQGQFLIDMRCPCGRSDAPGCLCKTAVCTSIMDCTLAAKGGQKAEDGGPQAGGQQHAVWQLPTWSPFPVSQRVIRQRSLGCAAGNLYTKHATTYTEMGRGGLAQTAPSAAGAPALPPCSAAAAAAAAAAPPSSSRPSVENLMLPAITASLGVWARQASSLHAQGKGSQSGQAQEHACRVQPSTR